jgi:hypothetical protein
MEKTCFIIMPISDVDPYPIGHFKRVYEFIIKPAVMNAGFQPIRADDILNTNYIAIDVIKRIIKCDMALCDLSARNPNVFYELGIRQAFNLPVTLMRDSLTKRAFDIQGFRDIEYDENLRIDNVETTKKLIMETLVNTYKDAGIEINSLVSLLGIHPAKVTSHVEISKDTEIILNTLDNFGARLSKIENLLPYHPIERPVFSLDDSNGIWQDISIEEASQLKVGDFIEHSKFGKGKITDKEGGPHNPIIAVTFQYGEPKKLMTTYAKLRKLIKND